MKRRLDEIRQLLNEIEEEIGTDSVSDSIRDFSAFELPLIIQEIVDDLQPLLTAHDTAFYWISSDTRLRRTGSHTSELALKAFERA